MRLCSRARAGDAEASSRASRGACATRQRVRVRSVAAGVIALTSCSVVASIPRRAVVIADVLAWSTREIEASAMRSERERGRTA